MWIVLIPTPTSVSAPRFLEKFADKNDLKTTI